MGFGPVTLSKGTDPRGLGGVGRKSLVGMVLRQVTESQAKEVILGKRSVMVRMTLAVRHAESM